MALKQYQLLTILITIAIGTSSALTWNPKVHRYESYDLERGPVFYEAYYPDNNENARNNYQEKHYFDREAVLERTYQLPSNRFLYPDEALQVERFQYPGVDPRSIETPRRNFPPETNYDARSNFFRKGDSVEQNHFPDQLDAETLDIKEISNLARRAISRDLENWNALENYLDRAKYQEPYHRQVVDPESGPTLLGTLKEGRDLRKGLYEEVLKGSSGPRNQIQSPEDQRNSNVVRRLTARDLANRNPGAFDPIRYQNQQTREEEAALLNKEDPRGSIADPYPLENIFEPRPQVINYIFSKKPNGPDKKAQSSEAKEKSKEPLPRNYGDNLIGEEIKKSEEGKDVKVTSIEVSEVPRHKTRHHHGEWPKRDYSHRHQ